MTEIITGRLFSIGYGHYLSLRLGNIWLKIRPNIDDEPGFR